MKYRKLTSYKYQLYEPYNLNLPAEFSGQMANLSHIILVNNLLHIKAGYAWNGATCAWDTKTFMKGSLEHDALYQLMRQGEMTRELRIEADRLLRHTCLGAGMSKFRADYVYNAVRLFAEGASKNGIEHFDRIYEV